MKNKVQPNDLKLAAKQLWPFGFLFAGIVGLLIAFAVAFGR